MKVAVFGDSYADELINRMDSGYPSWIEVLRTKYKLDIKSFGTSASSLYYSYKKLLEHKDEFDKVIFVSTSPCRITVPDNIQVSDKRFKHLNSIYTTQHNISAIEKGSMYGSELDLKILKAAENYFFYLHDNDREDLFHRMLVEKIKKDHPDVVFVNTISDWKNNESGLSCIALREISENGLDKESFAFHDLRMCHLSKTNNEILAANMFSWIHGKPVVINLEDYEVPPKEEIMKLIRR